TSPPFMTKRTRSSSVMSAIGSPATATRSANFPGSTAPTLSCHPSISAVLVVTERRTSSGGIPTLCSAGKIVALAWPRVLPGWEPAHARAHRDLHPRRQGAPDPLRSALLAVPLIAGATFGSEGRSEREALVDLRPETAVPGRRQAEEDALVAHLPELLVGGVV